MKLRKLICNNGWLTGTPQRGILAAILLFPLSILLTGCFTGIESTPKITYKDVRKQQVDTTPEQGFALNFKAIPFSEWKPGRRFLMADPKGVYTYAAPAGKSSSMEKGDTLIYRGVREVASITGGSVAELVFTVSGESSDTVLYRPGGDAVRLVERGNVRLPFLVDLSMVEDARGILVGKELVTRTDRWISPMSGKDVRGRKFIKVRVTGVDASDENYPFMVSFVSLEKSGEEGALMMSTTAEEGVPALRGFENLFLLDNPRDEYPWITDANWELIREGKVAEGMTPREVSLSLGNPREIDRRHDQSLLYERWSYPGGIYMIFEDGLLVRFNL